MTWLHPLKEKALRQTRYGSLPHEVLRGIVEQPLKKRVRGRDQKLYDLKVTADWVAPDSQDLDITVRLKRGWFGKTLTDSFRVTGPPSDAAALADDTVAG